MDEAELKLVQDSFSSVMAYLVYPHDFRESIERASKESQTIGAFMERLKQAISTEADPTRKTDGQIFLNELRKHLSG